jgi:hypothetical protein
MDVVDLSPTKFFREFIGLRGKVVDLRPGAPCEGSPIPCALRRTAGAPKQEMRLGDNDVENLVRRCVERKRFEKVARCQRGDEDSAAALGK